MRKAVEATERQCSEQVVDEGIHLMEGGSRRYRLCQLFEAFPSFMRILHSQSKEKYSQNGK